VEEGGADGGDAEERKRVRQGHVELREVLFEGISYKITRLR
jgi:hypothetical protein